MLGAKCRIQSGIESRKPCQRSSGSTTGRMKAWDIFSYTPPGFPRPHPAVIGLTSEPGGDQAGFEHPYMQFPSCWPSGNDW